MITYVYGDMFYSPARVLVNPVNTVGAMGAGLANDFKRFFPDMYEIYRDICHDDRLDTGELLLYRTSHKWILNFPTKRHFRASSKLEYIEEGLKKFALIYTENDITSVSFPALGTGNGGLDWEDVRPVMEAYLSPLPISVFIHHYSDQTRFAEKNRNTRAIKKWLNGQPDIESFEPFWRALRRIGRKDDNLRTFTTGMQFQIATTAASGRQRISLKISPKRGASIFVPETQLRDLWHYIRRAGYILPHNLPAGLEEHADYIVALLAQLPTLRPVELAAVNMEPVIGLHYIPPVAAAEAAQVVQLTS